MTRRSNFDDGRQGSGGGPEADANAERRLDAGLCIALVFALSLLAWAAILAPLAWWLG